tara:strand:+ start:1462 stop:2826 length:1365 start_codon:yes stop_codon:yes gene_type:complete
MAIIAGAGQDGATTFDVSNSVRFDSNSSEYLNQTFGTATNRKKFTLSLWIKRSELYAVSSETKYIMSGGTNASTNMNEFFFRIDTLYFNGFESSVEKFGLKTNAVFRDTSAWYHTVIAYDSTQGTASNRIKLYVNGVQVTSFATEVYPTQNYEPLMNSAVAHEIARNLDAKYFDGYMSEICFIDGQQLTPSSFGETDSNSGIWMPKEISGLTFGNNGFYLEFGNASVLGDDTSGNNNDWTAVNISSTNQSADAPTNNWCTGNPLYVPTSGAPSDWEDGALAASNRNTSNNWGGEATFRMSSGKWYWEVKVGANMGNGANFGIFTDGQHPYNGGTGTAWYSNQGLKQIDSTTSSYGATYTDNDILSFAYDADNGILVAYKNGVSQGTLFSGGAGKTYVPSFGIANGALQLDYFNFGNAAVAISSGNSDGNGYGNFEYAVPSGYYALNTKNLAEFG